MRCLTRIEMQEYIDSEVAPAARTEIVAHLKTCSKCMDLSSQTLKDSELISKLFREAGEDVNEMPVPQFVPPERKSMKKIYLRVIELLAAASIIGFIFFYRPAESSGFVEIPEAEMLLYDFYNGKDLNKIWHDNAQIIILQDEKGNVIQSIITN